MDRQYMPYWPPGPGRYAPVKDEPDYSKMGYEDGIKKEPGVGYEDLQTGYPNIKVEEPAIKQEYVEPKQEPEEKRGEKRQAHNQYGAPEPKRYRSEMDRGHVEDEPDYDKAAVLLDWYNSDLSLILSKDDFFSAEPLVTQGFGYVWHGVRATYGFLRGRVCFEVKVEDHLPVPQLEEEEQHPHVIRCGWSIDDAGLTLGEDPFSYGYGGTAKASTNLKFKDYGRPYTKGDVVGCFLDMDSEPIVMSFSLNGRNLGMCYEVSHRILKGKALFPHILTKNCSFKVNFGTEYPWFQPLTRYTYVGNIPQQERVPGTQAPETRQDSEIIMMVGLPACGKTTWVEKYCKENLEKKYYVMGTNFLIDKMKVNGLPRKRNYHGRWDTLIERCTKCLNKLLEMSYKRRRNFIIDQTNVYPSARRRKMKGFPGFYRRAVVVCPSDAELKRRTAKQISAEGKVVPDSAIMEMMVNFTLPEVEDDLFDAVEFVELDAEESNKQVDQYVKDAQSAGFKKKPSFRGNPGRGGKFRGGWNRDHSGGSNDREAYSKPRGGFSGNQDNRSNSNNRGGYSRDSYGGNNRDGQSRDSSMDRSSRDNSRGGFGRDSSDGDNRGGFGRGSDSNRGGFSRGSDSNRGGFGRGSDSSRGGFGRGSFANSSRDGPRGYNMDRDNDNSFGGYNRNSYGGSTERSSRDFNRGDDTNRGGFSTESFGGSTRNMERAFDNSRGGFTTESFGGSSRDTQRGIDNSRGGLGQDSLGGNRDMQRGFNVDRDNRDSDNNRGSYNRDTYSGSNNRDTERGYNVDNRDNSSGGNDGKGGFSRDTQRSMDRNYSRGGSDTWGGFSSRSFSTDRERDSRGDSESRGGYSRESYGSNSRDSYGSNTRDVQRGYGSYDSPRNMGTPRGSQSNQDHGESSGYSSLSSSTGSLSAGQNYGNSYNSRQYGQQQYWGQNNESYGTQQSSASSQQSYGRSSDRSASPAGGGTGTGSTGTGTGTGGGAGTGGGGSTGGNWSGSGGNWSGSGSGNQQYNYASSYRGQRQ